MHFGEGSYDETEAAIRSLLVEAGDSRLGREARAKPSAPLPVCAPRRRISAPIVHTAGSRPRAPGPMPTVTRRRSA